MQPNRHMHMLWTCIQDSDDDWDKSDDELEKRLGQAGISNAAPAFDDEEEEDLLVKEKEADEKANKVSLKAKGSALAKKKVSSFVFLFVPQLYVHWIHVNAFISL